MLTVNQIDGKSVSTTHSCDGCKTAEYLQKLNESYDPTNYPGTGWMTIAIEGDEKSNHFTPIHLCPECSGWIKTELILHNVEGRNHADAKTVAASESPAKEPR